MAQFAQNRFLDGVFETTMRYSSIRPLRINMFGLVCSAEDRKYPQSVVIQKYSEPIATASVIKHILREVKLLRQMKHENLMALVDIFASPSQDIYLVTELMKVDLHTLLRSKPIQGEFVQYILYQIMRGLKYLHSAGVVHGDLQPSNVMVNHNCDIKIQGYGQSRAHGPWMTRAASSQYYLAPEVMLTDQGYDELGDIWSAGCIFAELLQGKPLFPGQNDIHQIHIITELIGTPSETVAARMTGQNKPDHIQSFPESQGQPFSTFFSGIDSKAIELLENMLVFDPQGRVTASETLGFTYLAPYHDSTDEPEAQEKIDWTFYTTTHSVNTWKEKLHAEIFNYHEEEASREAVQQWLRNEETGFSAV